MLPKNAGVRSFLISRSKLNLQKIIERLEQLKRPGQSVVAALKGLPKPVIRPDDYDDSADYGAIPNHLAMCHSRHVMNKIARLDPGTGPMSYRRLHPLRPSNTLFSGHRATRPFRRTAQYNSARGRTFAGIS